MESNKFNYPIAYRVTTDGVEISNLVKQESSQNLTCTIFLENLRGQPHEIKNWQWGWGSGFSKCMSCGINKHKSKEKTEKFIEQKIILVRPFQLFSFKKNAGRPFLA